MAFRTFAPLPGNQLVPSDKAAEDRQRMAQQRQQQAAAAVQRQRQRAAEQFTWPERSAPLPADRLVRREDR